MIKIFDSYALLESNVARGSMRLLIIDGKKIGLAHSLQGKVFAFDAHCPHQYEQLTKGIITRFDEVVCPLHHYRFNMTNGKEVNSRCKDLVTYSISIDGDGVFLKM